MVSSIAPDSLLDSSLIGLRKPDGGVRPIAIGEVWTHLYRREESYTHVDHILISPGLRAAVRDGVARIFDGDGVREASDHRPVMVALIFEPRK